MSFLWKYLYSSGTNIATNLEKTALESNIVSNLATDSSLLHILEKVITDYKKQKKIHSIPLNLFLNSKLGILEVTVKYLKENQELAHNEIAELLNRDQRTIWTTYSKASKKHKEPFSIKAGETIDISIFTDRNQAPLQALVRHLREKGLSYTKIAQLLNRSYKTIWITSK